MSSLDLFQDAILHLIALQFKSYTLLTVQNSYQLLKLHSLVTRIVELARIRKKYLCYFKLYLSTLF